MYALALASGAPPAILDWNNNYADETDKCVCTHCANYPKSFFGIEPEITVKIAKRRLRVYEIGISYSGRTYAEGKKIGWKDGVKAFWCLLKYSATERRMPAAAPAIVAGTQRGELPRSVRDMSGASAASGHAAAKKSSPSA